MAITPERETPAAERPVRRKYALIQDGVLVLASVGVLTAVAAGAYWEQSATKSAASAAAPAQAKTVPVRTASVQPWSLGTPGTQVVHADVFFDASRTRLRADAVTVLQQT